MTKRSERRIRREAKQRAQLAEQKKQQQAVLATLPLPGEFIISRHDGENIIGPKLSLT